MGYAGSCGSSWCHGCDIGEVPADDCYDVAAAVVELRVLTSLAVAPVVDDGVRKCA